MAGKEGVVHILSNTYADVLKVELLFYNPDLFNLTIRSIDTANDGKRIILGTYSSEIYELISNDLKISPNSKYEKVDINKGPFTIDSVNIFEMWGLAMFKTPKNIGNFLTCSDDGILRIWSIKERRMLSYMELHSNSKGENQLNSDDSKLRCVSLNPTDEIVAIGCKSGAIRVRKCGLTL